MDGFEFPQPISTCLDIHAVEAMRKEILSSDVPDHCSNCCINEYCFVTDPYPEVKENIAEIVMMGGSQGEIQIQVPNLMYVDPHAAQIVFQSGVR